MYCSGNCCDSWVLSVGAKVVVEVMTGSEGSTKSHFKHKLLLKVPKMYGASSC